MELTYISRAVRRFWWAPVFLVVLGLISGLFLTSLSGASYEAEALVLVSPTSEDGDQFVMPDRYVLYQLVVFESGSLADRVAEQIDGMTAEEVMSAAAFDQLGGTDIVRVRATSSSPLVAQDIANTYATTYLDYRREQRVSARVPELESLDAELDETLEQLNALNEQIQEELAAFAAQSPARQGLVPIDQISPALATERDVTRDRYVRLLGTRYTVVADLTRGQASNRLLQEAGVPTDPTSTSPAVLGVAGVLVGGMFGGLAAVGFARFSPRVLDAEEVVQLLGVPLAGSLPKDPSTARRDLLLTEPLSKVLHPVVHQLSVRAEAVGSASPLIVVVAGGEQGAGTTTLATAMAKRFAVGAEVLLIDASTTDPELSMLAGAHASGVRDFLESGESIDAPSGRQAKRSNRSVVDLRRSPTGLRALYVAGLGAEPASLRIRSDEVKALIDAASNAAEVVVFDAGPMMSAASSLRLAEMADVVVLAVPGEHQGVTSLEVIGHQLRNCPGLILPVLTPASSRQGRRIRR